MLNEEPVTGDRLAIGDLITYPQQRRVVNTVPVVDPRLLAVLGEGAQVVTSLPAVARLCTDRDVIPPRCVTADEVFLVARPEVA